MTAFVLVLLFQIEFAYSNVQMKKTLYSLPKGTSPFVGGFVRGGVGFICSPILFLNYIYDSAYLDKIYNDIMNKYSIKIIRTYQYDHYDNKYAYPSSLIIEITELNKNIKIVKY